MVPLRDGRVVHIFDKNSRWKECGCSEFRLEFLQWLTILQVFRSFDGLSCEYLVDLIQLESLEYAKMGFTLSTSRNGEMQTPKLFSAFHMFLSADSGMPMPSSNGWKI